VKASEFRKLIREEVRNYVKENADSRFKHQPVDDAILANVKAALRNINQRALTKDTANLVLQNEIDINKDGDIVIRFYSKPRK
jgi:hypothetical protein